MAIALAYLRLLGAIPFLRMTQFALRRRLEILRHPGPRTYVGLAKAVGGRLAKASSPNDQAVIQLVREMRIDVIINGTGYIYKSEILGAPRIAAINKHSSLLPYYRGVFPVLWTLLDGKLPIGLTIHIMKEQVDQGGILVQEAFPELRNERSIIDIYQKLHHEEARLLCLALEAVQDPSKRIRYTQLPSGHGSYCSLPKRSDILRLEGMGYRFV